VNIFKQSLIKNIEINPDEIRSLTDLRKYLEEIPAKVVELNKKVDGILEM